MEPKLLDDAFCLARTCCLARSYCRRAGLSAEDTEDCAAAFAEKMLTTSPPASHVGAWMRECARNHVVDYIRTQRRRRAHECGWPETASDDGPLRAWDCPDGAPSADSALLRDECWKRLMAVLAELAPIPQQVFLRHHLSSETAEEIGASLGRTPHAIEQSLSRSRKQLRAALERHGLTEAELCQYLADGPSPLLPWHHADSGSE